MQINNNIKEFIKKHAYFLLGGACIFIIGIIYIVSRGTSAEIIRDGEVIFHAEESEDVMVSDEEIPETTPEPHYIVIHITGAVNAPGVFEIPDGARVNDALELAGGATADADLRRVNLAAFLQDAMQIVIPTEGEELETVFIFADDGDSEASGIRNDGLININTATSSELQSLSGIGPVLAQNIIDFRETHGSFSSVDELIHVPRIGEVTLERLRPSVTVN